jgi:hypothetical protein
MGPGGWGVCQSVIYTHPPSPANPPISLRLSRLDVYTHPCPFTSTPIPIGGRVGGKA